jgi:hypothetical protein
MLQDFLKKGGMGFRYRLGCSGNFEQVTRIKTVCSFDSIFK